MADTGLTRHYRSFVPAQATANAGQSTILPEIKIAGRVTEVSILPAAAVAANGTNYRTWTLYNRGSDGTGTTVMATMDTSTTGLTDNDERLMTLSATAANLVVAAGDVLELVETVAAAGVAHSGGQCDVAVMGTTA